MITAYHRPKNLEEALELLASPNVRPLGGGTILSHSEGSIAVVDLQSLGLNKLHKSGDLLEIGATVTLQSLLESPHIPAAIKTALKLEAPINLRNMGTVAGTLVSCDGRSPFAAVMLALDAKLTIVNAGSTIATLGNFLPLRVEAEDIHPGKLIIKIEIPLNASLAFEYVARTRADKPIVCAALSQWPSGRTRLIIGGWGASPSLALDGMEFSGIEAAARNVAHDALDQWASAEYRSDIAAVLARRCLEGMKKVR